ncbi:lipase chaperone [Microbulbifer litoralis]|uniref:lipase chaperone n=1 Tax=Microbulbifer litoralis TaxID=2933965 RepID=UPI002028158A
MTTTREPEENPGHAALAPPEPASARIYDALLLLNFDKDGALILDRNTRGALEILYPELAVSGGSITATQLQALLEGALPEAAAQQLTGVVRSYSDYRQAERDFLGDSGGRRVPADRSRYRQLLELRRNYFGEELASGLFAEEEIQAPYIMDAMAVAGDENLSGEERARRLADLQRQFNRETSRMGSPLARRILAARVQRMRAAGAGEAQVFSVRSEALGSAEAQRLAEAEHQRQDAAGGL